MLKELEQGGYKVLGDDVNFYTKLTVSAYYRLYLEV